MYLFLWLIYEIVKFVIIYSYILQNESIRLICERLVGLKKMRISNKLSDNFAR